MHHVLNVTSFFLLVLRTSHKSNTAGLQKPSYLKNKTNFLALFHEH